MSDDLAYATATQLNTALAARTVSAVELADAAIARIEKLDGAINAVVVRDFERARETAKAADTARARGETKPLLGIPMTVKEAMNVAGLKTTWGFPGFAEHIAQEDGVAIQRLKDAGAVILGKTNVPVFLADWQSNNPLYGRTNNPYDLTKTAGGSSGGAAAVASGMVPLEFGSDLGGSIRVPAAFCGIYGHKPSFGIVPMRGFKPPPAADGAGIPVSVLGPLARSADDLTLALDVVAGPEAMDAIGYHLALPPARHSNLTGFRVLILDRHPATAVDREIVDTLHTLGGNLERHGAAVARNSELLPDLMRTLQCFGTILGVATSRGGPPVKDGLSAHGWMEVMDEQLAIRRQWAALFEQFDVVLAPAFGTVAFAHDDTQGERTLLIDGEKTPYGTQGAWSSMAGVANLPATAAPIGKTKTGLPIGIQIIGPYLEDRTTIAFAKLLEDTFGGFAPPPL
ncbi:MAG TPA: amidase family protein [Rhizomicrobium sp.]